MTDTFGTAAPLFAPFTVASITLKNRIVISPMCMYSAVNGMASDFHLGHYGRFALGGAGLVILEATAVLPEGRVSHGDLGLWCDDQIAPLARIVEMLKAQGTAVGIQLVHGGRKACRQRPWSGYQGVNEQNAINGETPWPIVAPSPVALSANHQTPRELDRTGIELVREAFRSATRRAWEAGFDVVELHAAHGFLVHGFMSPVTNQRDDEYGGDFEQRHRLAYEVVSDMREVWPADRPFFVRVSLEDGADGGRPFTETIRFSAQLKQLGVDVVDCSSGGIGGHSSANSQGGDLKYAPHVSPTATLREQAGVNTMAVGLITQPDIANRIIADGQSDLVGIGRQALLDPNWPLHSRAYLERGTPESPFSHWPEPYGWWLERHASMIQKIEAQAERQ